MSSELDVVIQHALNSDPTLAAEAKGLLARMMREARLVMDHGTPQMKATLISRGLSSILSHAATAKQTDEFADMRAALDEIRSHVFADVASMPRPDQSAAPTAPTAPEDTSTRTTL